MWIVWKPTSMLPFMEGMELLHGALLGLVLLLPFLEATATEGGSEDSFLGLA